MELREAVLALEVPAKEINGGINAIGIMAAGLTAEKDPYAEGINAVWNYLFDANEAFQRQLQACLRLI